MLQVRPKPPIPGEVKEGLIEFTFLPRSETTPRSFDKSNSISMQLHVHHLGEFLVSTDVPDFTLSVPSDVSHFPIKFKCSTDEEKKIILEASLAKPHPRSVSVKASHGDFKVLQTLIQSAIPVLFRWPTTHERSAEHDSHDPKRSSTNSASRFFSN